MPVLAIPGLFTMLVPDGWTVTAEPDGPYELTRSGDGGAAHISVYHRTASDSPLSEAEAFDLTARFLAGTGAADDGVPIHVLPDDDEQHRAVARFNDGTSGWLVFLVLWRDRLVICSCTTGVTSPMLAEAEMMFATIHRPEP